MYKSKIILALLVSTICTAPSMSFAAEATSEVEPIKAGLPMANMGNAQAPKTTDVDGVPLVEESTKPKLKSVKELFKSKASNSKDETGANKSSLDSVSPSKPAAEPAPTVIDTKPNNVENGLTPPESNGVSSISADAPEEKTPEVAPKPAAVEERPEDLPVLNGMNYAPTSPNDPAQTPVDPNAPVDPNEKADDAQEKKPVFDPNVEGRSIMFNQISILRVMQVLSAYIESKSNQIPDDVQEQRKKSLEELQQELLAKLKPEEFVKGKKDIVTVKLPAYVKVDSLIYRSPTNKQVWINRNKFSEGDSNSEITVKAIEKEWVYVELSAKDTNVDLKKFKAILKKSKKIQPITIDEEKQTISFRLSINQYIDLEILKIKEGTFDVSKADLDNKSGHYYDPTKPEERFVPLEEAEKAAEAAQATAATTAASDEAPQESKSDANFQAIDANEGEDGTDDESTDQVKASEESGLKKDASDVPFTATVGNAGDNEIKTPAKQ